VASGALHAPIVLPFDCLDYSKHDSTVAAAIACHGHIDTIVLNAGVLRYLRACFHS
jgi:NADP-dependent 3-hydroxy acid dehydrogenase YdfG